MKRNTLIWMGIQAAMFAAAFWMQWEMSRETGKPFSFAGFLFFGFIGAFGVTALWFDARPRLLAWFRRMVSPPPAVLRDVDAGAFSVPAITSQDREAGRQGERLIAAGGSGSDGPKLTGSRRVR